MALVGVLALQGSFNEHIAALRRLGVKGVEIRKPAQLDSVASLIIPGGESTTMAKLAEYHNLFPALREFVKMGKPVWGTCAGLIFLANKAVGQKTGGQELVGGLDCTVHRNFFGSQIQSFEAELPVPELASKEGGPETFPGVFIRAPAILEVGPEVQVLADYPVPSDVLDSNSTIESPEEKIQSEKKVIVAVRQGNLLGTAFHPELTADTRWHSYFLKMANDVAEGASTSIIAVGVDLVSRSHERPFRFQPGWLSHPGFLGLVCDAWAGNISLINAVELFTITAKKWNKEVFGNLFYRKRRVEARLKGVQSALASNLNNFLLELEYSLRKERRRNKTSFIKDNVGNCISDENEVAEYVRKWYFDLFTTEMGDSQLRTWDIPNWPVRINDENADYLSRPISDEEIRDALWALKAFKAPGLDGLHAGFFQRFWLLVGGSLKKMVKEVFSSGSMLAH
ncbi:hypothetical protein CMV_005325 [Castanea mollissima]|uniref:glutaminase n=1 Tax=Castanea mollissima TaxID=60419 RepID=A0A8J4RD77_9ROSI|nr:hypothetical protein CMV_005325 [Castanea mollissima]